jgi:hypothetical protein
MNKRFTIWLTVVIVTMMILMYYYVDKNMTQFEQNNDIKTTSTGNTLSGDVL